MPMSSDRTHIGRIVHKTTVAVAQRSFQGIDYFDCRAHSNPYGLADMRTSTNRPDWEIFRVVTGSSPRFGNTATALLETLSALPEELSTGPFPQPSPWQQPFRLSPFSLANE